MHDQKILNFPKDFRWGVSTSAYQIEGGNVNDWSEWEKSEVIKLRQISHSERIKKFPPKADQPLAEELKNLNPSDFICGQARDSYNRYEEDMKLVKNLNCQAYRFSLEWSRLEPEPGNFNKPAFEHYRQQIRILRSNAIEPFVTLWHWTNPLWLARAGGWENKETIRHFLKYVEKVLAWLGSDIKYWLTLNEPETYVGLGYVAGIFPPQVKSLFRANNVFKNLMAAHRQAYRLIKTKLKNQAQAGLTHYFIYQTPYKNDPLNRGLVKLLDYIRWQRFLKASADCQDFIGFQYYHHDRIKFKLGGRFLIAEAKNENKEVTDMGWEIYPEGIYHLLKYLKKYNKPIYITENGIADEDDDQRQKFITDHLKYIHQAIQDGVDVRGYFYWSLLDNFEWQHGWKPKFGLYSVDRQTFKRTARPSAKFYSEICQNNFITIK